MMRSRLQRSRSWSLTHICVVEARPFFWASLWQCTSVCEASSTAYSFPPRRTPSPWPPLFFGLCAAKPLSTRRRWPGSRFLAERSKSRDDGMGCSPRRGATRGNDWGSCNDPKGNHPGGRKQLAALSRHAQREQAVHARLRQAHDLLPAQHTHVGWYHRYFDYQPARGEEFVSIPVA